MKLLPSWLKKGYKEIREFFWPLLDDEEEEANQGSQLEVDLKITKVNVKKAFELKTKISESENDRRNSIESKASLFISTISVTTSVVVAANALTVGNNDYPLATQISVFISFILTVYTVRTVWFSVKALDRKGYHVLGFNDINIGGTEEEYHRTLLINLANKTKANEAVINEKVDNFVLAQEYYKRAIIVICLYAFAVLIFCIFIKKINHPDKDKTPKMIYVKSIIS